MKYLNWIQRPRTGATIPATGSCHYHKAPEADGNLRQTHSLVKNGIIDMLPDKITMVHGPGCPVCVTPVSIIDEAVYLAKQPNTIICSFGDMLRVPGSEKVCWKQKAEGADVRILYSPLEAVALAKRKSGKRRRIVFCCGFWNYCTRQCTKHCAGW